MAISQEVIQSAQLLINVNQFNQQMELERAKFLHEVEYQDRIYKLKDQELKITAATNQAKLEADQAEQRKKTAETAKAELEAKESMSKSILKDAQKRLPDDKNPYRGYGPDELQSLYVKLTEAGANFMSETERREHDKTKGLVLAEYRNLMTAWEQELNSRPLGSDPIYDKPLTDLKRYRIWGNREENPGLPFPVPQSSAAPLGTGNSSPLPLPGAAATAKTSSTLIQAYQNPTTRATLGEDLRRAFDDMRKQGYTDEQVRVQAMQFAAQANSMGAGKEDLQNIIVGASVRK